MEIEKFLSGYCRQLDAARTVCVVVDCCYGCCTHQGCCCVALEIEELRL